MEQSEPGPDRYDASLTVEGRYRLLVESITDYAIYMLSPGGIVTSWNPGAVRFKGYTSAEIIGKHFSRFYTKEDQATGVPQRALDTASKAGKFESEGWRVRKDGTRFWAYVVIDSIRDPNGTLTGYAKITWDLSERKKAEESLRRSEERLRLLVHGVTDYAIYLLTPEGVIDSWNMGAERIKGYQQEEVIGTNFSRFYVEADRKNGEPQRALATAAREGRFETESRRVRKDGTIFWAHVVIDALQSDSGELLGFAKVTRDVTAQHESRLALEKARETLAQAQKMDAIGQLTGGVAHDFNNLLMVILSALELLRKRLPDDPKVTFLLNNAVLGAKRGSALTKRLLAFARQQDLQVEAIDVPTLVNGMSELLQRSISPSIQIELRFPLNLSPASCDPNQLELAILNLVINSRDAMPRGGSIEIAASEVDIGTEAPEAGPGRYICISVKDSGEGMDAATLARAVDPFFTTKGVGKGTGLGLAMVHGLAGQSGGRLVLKSQQGKGTSAEILLPVAKASDIPVSAPASEAVASDTMRPLVVVVVDDDPLVLGNTVAMLDDLEHAVYNASSGAQALDLLRKQPRVDLLITDYLMPGMTGGQLIELIHAERPELPVIIVTGFAEVPAHVAQRVVRLPKPFDQAELRRAIRRAVVEQHAKPKVIPLFKRD